MTPEATYKKGERIGGRFLVHEMKQGGMGEVYLCLDEQQNLPFALKTVKRENRANPTARALFEREVGAWVSLGQHGNIVRYYHLETFDDLPFMLLEWVSGDPDRGVSLREWLQHRGVPELRPALDLVIDIVRGLAYAQEQAPGLVHRDLKPENVLVAQGPLAKVTDFGLARLADAPSLTEAPAADPARTSRWLQRWSTRRNARPAADEASVPMEASVHHTRIAGTAPYMAPEQWLGRRLDARTDMYALGCILHELLTGRLPYAGNSLERWKALHLESPAPRAPELPGVPASVGLIVERCLQKVPADRYPTLAALLDALDAVYRAQFRDGPRPGPEPGEFNKRDYNNRGNTYQALQRYDEALADYARTIKLWPVYADAYYNRGITYQALQRYDEALADYARAIGLQPTYAATYNNRGIIYHALQRYDEALADYARTIELRPELAEAYVNRGNTYQALQRPDEALADYARAIELRRGYADAYFNRGITYQALQRYDEALADYARAIGLRPTYADAYNNRGNTYHALQRYEDALADYAHAIELRPAYAEAYNNRGTTYKALQRYDEALSDYASAIELRPVQAEAYVNRGTTYKALQRYDEALADYARAIGLGPTYADAYNNRGNTYHALQRYEDALADYAHAIELRPAYAEAYNNRGVTYQALQRYDEALADYTRAIELQPAFALAYLNIGVLYGNLGQYREALPFFERAAELGDPVGAQFVAMVRQPLGSG